MYAPMRLTVTNGLASRAAECGYVVREGEGYDSHAYKLMMARANPGDVVVWIGLLGSPEFFGDARALHSRGIDEIWDYSHAHSHGSLISRVVPPGFVAIGECMHQPVVPVARFVFLGSKNRDRPICLDRLANNSDVGSKLSTLSGVWQPQEWRDLAARTNRTVFLNFHKFCTHRHLEELALETVRLSSLLSVGAVVVTQTSNDMDLALFRDMVFVEPEFLGRTWNRALLTLLASEPERMDRWRRRAYALFRSRMDPKAIMLRAKVWDDTVIRNHNFSSSVDPRPRVRIDHVTHHLDAFKPPIPMSGGHGTRHMPLPHRPPPPEELFQHWYPQVDGRGNLVSIT
ncbi:hypothetical protein CTAYLR_008697 [Chrysophaeum taylorii]|uniref:Uncharacterized protein n=1 Tax=Chrysophaeum taylorii TaxID=2483200 RepID=A0AAD7XPL8_9STRA|nr:hypothetical protein CTAYLR_008697 [Chrysophaeum taylorii]